MKHITDLDLGKTPNHLFDYLVERQIQSIVYQIYLVKQMKTSLGVMTEIKT